jgi:hypothetical protein
VALELSPFGKLPPELVIYIAKFLPDGSIALLSLSCRPIYFILRPKDAKAWKALTRKVGAKCDELLATLERDLASYIACHYCNKLHNTSTFKRYVPSKFYYSKSTTPAAPPCVKDRQNIMTGWYLNDDFCYTVFQMTMKLYREGKDYTKMLDSLVKNRRRFTQMLGNSV